MDLKALTVCDENAENMSAALCSSSGARIVWSIVDDVRHTAGNGSDQQTATGINKALTHTIGGFIITGLISLLAVILNLINIYIFTRPKMLQFPLYRFLLALSVSDFLSSLIACPLTFYRCYHCVFNNLSHGLATYAAHVYYPFVNAFLGISSWTTVAATVGRYVYITTLKPKDRRAIIRTGNVIILMTYYTLILYHLPMIFFLGVEECVSESESNNVTIYVLNYTATGTLFDVYNWARFVLMQLIPWITLTTFNVLLFVIIRRQRQFQATPDPNTYRNYLERKMTKMIICWVFIYLVLNVQSGLTTNASIVGLLLGIPVSELNDTYQFTILKSIGNAFEFFSNCVPFMIYCTFNNSYRIELRNLCCQFSVPIRRNKSIQPLPNTQITPTVKHTIAFK